MTIEHNNTQIYQYHIMHTVSVLVCLRVHCIRVFSLKKTHSFCIHFVHVVMWVKLLLLLLLLLLLWLCYI